MIYVAERTKLSKEFLKYKDDVFIVLLNYNLNGLRPRDQEKSMNSEIYTAFASYNPKKKQWAESILLILHHNNVRGAVFYVILQLLL